MDSSELWILDDSVDSSEQWILLNSGDFLNSGFSELRVLDDSVDFLNFRFLMIQWTIFHVNEGGSVNIESLDIFLIKFPMKFGSVDLVRPSLE